MPTVPSIQIGIALNTPTLSGTEPPDPFAQGVIVPQFYRLYEQMDDALLRELPLSVIQCTRRVGASTWMSLRVPGEYEVTEGHLVIVRSGIIAQDGEEQIGEFLRGVVTDVDDTIEPQSAVTVITARVQNPSFAQQTRTAQAVSRRIDDDGRKSIQCAVDPLLRPNDTIDDDGDTWTAGTIEYRITHVGARMVVTEAL